MKTICLSLLLAGNVSLIAAQDVQPSFTSFNHSEVPANNEVSATRTMSGLTKKKSYFRIGEKVLSLVKYGEQETTKFVLLALHHSEFTASQAARQYILKNGGRYMELDNDFQRNIEFSLFNRQMMIDPDRIFTPSGRWNDLTANKKTDHIISQQISGLANFILSEIPQDKAIVSVHNNSEGEYTITQYKKGGSMAKDARMLYINPEKNANDFFVTTDKHVFEKMKENKFNTVLLTYSPKDDGSLSIYCAKTKRSYIGVETQLGHFNEQEEMIAAVAGFFR